MSKIKLLDLEFETYITANEIAQATSRVARAIEADYMERATLPILLITLNGAAPWAMQLAQELRFDATWGFVKCSSYGASTVSSGQIKMEVPPTVDFVERDVIVVEDIVDSGLTWTALHDYLMEHGASSVRIATMAFKAEAYRGTAAVDYIALRVNNLFLVGNGLDYNQQGRNLKDIHQLCK